MPVGQDIALAALALFQGQQTPDCHITDVHQIVSTPDAGGQFAFDIVGNQLDQMVAGAVIGAQNSGRDAPPPRPDRRVPPSSTAWVASALVLAYPPTTASGEKWVTSWSTEDLSPSGMAWTELT